MLSKTCHNILVIICVLAWLPCSVPVGSGFWPNKNGSRAQYIEQCENFGILLNEYRMDNFKVLLFCAHTFGVIRLIDVLDQANRPGSG